MPKLFVGMCPCLTAQVLKSLKANNIHQVLDFVSINPEKITSSCGLSYKKVLSIRRHLLAQYSAFPISGLTLYKKTLEVCAVLPTSCSNVDVALDDGIYTGEVTEIVGVSVSGKTQFCQTLSLNVAAVLEQNSICIDTTIGWNAKRMLEMLTCRFPGKSASSTLSRVRLSRCFKIEELNSVLAEIRSGLQLREDPFYSSLKLLVIDSVAAVLSPCFFSGTYIEGLSMLQQFGRNLNALAKDFNIAIVITNNMVSSGKISENYAMKPALGRCWTFVPSVRLIFKPACEPSQNNENLAADWSLFQQTIDVILDKSPRSGVRTTSFYISKSGIEGKDFSNVKASTSVG